MIIQNGTIKFKTKSATGIDLETGYPKKPTADSWGSLIPCQYAKNKYNNLGMVQGEHFNVAQYSILIEEQGVPSEQIMLSDMSGNEIGKFSIMNHELLEAVCEIKILV